MNRRRFLHQTGTAVAATALTSLSPALNAQSRSSKTKMRIDLTFPKLGMGCDQTLAVSLAGKNGFQSVGGDTGRIGNMNRSELDALNALREQNRLVWGTCGLPVDFRGEEARFKDGLAQLKLVAPKVQHLGIGRMTTWISPSHGELTYLQNFKRHAERLKQIDAVLADHDIRLGLEYVGTQLLRFNRKQPFIHTSAEVIELIDATGGTQLGLILDCWHWWTSGEDTSDLKKIDRSQIVSVEINDAPEGIEREYQKDNQRGLPATTGILPLKDFLTAVSGTGFDGPLMAEPFYAPLRKMSPEEAAAEVAAALKRSVALID